MSDYDRRYNVHANMVSHYTDDPAEALRLLDSDPERGFCNEGYADHDYIGPGHRDFRGIEGTLVSRRTIGKVSRSTLEFRAGRAEVMRLLATLRGTA